VQFFFWLGGSRLQVPAEYRPLDEPRYRPVAEVPQYRSDAEVLGVEVNGVAKAIPAKRIAWHLVVNDEIGGEPVVITLCTVTDAALAYRARLDTIASLRHVTVEVHHCNGGTEPEASRA
jgi:hypothetical protein